MARRASVVRIKSNRSYTIEETAEIVGVTEQTVRRWIRDGLPAMKENRPFLILGSSLKKFWNQSKQKRKRRLLIGQFYCMCCKASREAAEGVVFYSPQSLSHGRLEAFCVACGGVCQRMVRTEDLRLWASKCEIDHNALAQAYGN